MRTPIGTPHFVEKGGGIFSEPLRQISENGSSSCSGPLRQSSENRARICSEPLRPTLDNEERICSGPPPAEPQSKSISNGLIHLDRSWILRAAQIERFGSD